MANKTLPGDQLLPGEIIAGKYRLVDLCGSGGMGSVWRATHLVLDSAVAIKFLHGSVSRQSEARARFEQEAKICAKLGDESHHVVRVSDHGITERGRPFLVMELLKGESLSERLEREGRLPLPLVAVITTQLCRALHVAHVAGVVHRDLKPANIFLSRSGAAGDDGVFVKLLDFGVAKATLAMDDPGVTRAGFIVGTPAYMSPEQITAEQFLDARADLWSVVAIAYRMAVGAPPFGTGTIAELGKRITSDEPTPPSQLVADLPPAFDAWIARGLAKGRDARFQATTDLADSLTEVARDAPTSAPSSTMRRPESFAVTRAAEPATTRDAQAPRLSAASAVDWQPPRSASPTLIAIAIFLALALAASGFLYSRSRATTTTTTAPTQASEQTSPSAFSVPITVVVDANAGAQTAQPSIAAAGASTPSSSTTSSASSSAMSSSTSSSTSSTVAYPKKPGPSVGAKPVEAPMPHNPAGASSDENGRPDPTASATAPKPDEDF